MYDKLDNMQWRIRWAVQRLHKRYNRNPWIFLSEADVQCYLYAELLKDFTKPVRATGLDANSKKLRDSKYRIRSIPLHAELSSFRRKNVHYVDLSLVDPKKISFFLPVKTYDRDNRAFPISGMRWHPEDMIGIEIKYNWGISKTSAYNKKTGRTKTTARWTRFRDSLVEDMKKLRSYKRGWLIYVDQTSMFHTFAEWRTFVDDVVRRSNYGYRKKTLNAYYLCPRRKLALSFKSPEQTSY